MLFIPSPGKARRKRQTFDGADLASIVNALEQPGPGETAGDADQVKVGGHSKSCLQDLNQKPKSKTCLYPFK